jgi:sugar O-acyltransferase (sialic acid O-acetyltransferase NeuD family)
MTTLYLCGAGNAEGVRLALAINRVERRWDRIVLLDDDPAKRGQSLLGVEIAGPFDMLHEVDRASAEVSNMVARTTMKRRSAQSKIEEHGIAFATLVGPGVDVEGVELGRGVIVYRNANVGPLVALGEGSVVFMGAAVGHGSQTERGCVVAPGAVVNARVRLGEGVYVGTNATILPDVTVGPWATIAAGSVAIQDVPAGATVIGVPGKVLDLRAINGGSRGGMKPLLGAGG